MRADFSQSNTALDLLFPIEKHITSFPREHEKKLSDNVMIAIFFI